MPREQIPPGAPLTTEPILQQAGTVSGQTPKAGPSTRTRARATNSRAPDIVWVPKPPPLAPALPAASLYFKSHNNRKGGNSASFEKLRAVGAAIKSRFQSSWKRQHNGGGTSDALVVYNPKTRCYGGNRLALNRYQVSLHSIA